MDYVDLILLHGPATGGGDKCDAAACAKDLGQWKAYEKLYKAGKARAIGVSNYCVSCLECLIGQPGVSVTPAVNQIKFHAYMGADPEGLLSYNAKHNITVQARRGEECRRGERRGTAQRGPGGMASTHPGPPSPPLRGRRTRRWATAS